MENKIFTVAIIGVGARGGDVYGTLMSREPNKYKIVSLCDLKQDRLDRFSKEFGVDTADCFIYEEDFFKKKRADILIIATQDKDHVRHCMKAFELGYDVLLEKPITDDIEECHKLLECQKKNGNKALVCHVLRYSPTFLKVAEILDSGAIGRLVAINSLERVAYWHQAHSFVRGNWRNTKDSAPMILAKCCHDLDLLQYYAKSKCVSVSSVGDLTFFTPENAPDGAAKRCTECKYMDTCPYSAKRIYIDRWEAAGSPVDRWPYNIAANIPLSKEGILSSISENAYGRCVFHCDNNVVDHQMVQMTFENGVKVSHTMTAFTAGSGRRMHFIGTLGEMIFDDAADPFLTVSVFGGETTTFKAGDVNDALGYGHGGGDYFLVQNLYELLSGRGESTTSLEASLESHLIGAYAEESRKMGGKLLYVHK